MLKINTVPGQHHNTWVNCCHWGKNSLNDFLSLLVDLLCIHPLPLFRLKLSFACPPNRHTPCTPNIPRVQGWWLLCVTCSHTVPSPHHAASLSQQQFSSNNHTLTPQKKTSCSLCQPIKNHLGLDAVRKLLQNHNCFHIFKICFWYVDKNVFCCFF